MSLLPKSLTDRYFKTYRRILGGDDYTRSLHQQVNELRSRLQAVAGDELEDGPSSWKWRAVELARHTATRINGLQSRFLPGSMSRPIERLISRGFPAPLVSVIMTAFNCRDYLRDAISTALWQTYGNVELIVVDDRSDDGTFDLLCEIAEDDDRIRVLQTDERGGTYRAKNLGLSQAFGQYVTFQDSDDLVAPTRLSAQVSGLLVRPWAVASVCRYTRFDEDSEVVMNRGRYTRRALISLLFKRDVVLRRLGFFDEVWTSADDEFVERLTRVFGPRALVDLPSPLYFARVHRGSLTQQVTASLGGSDDVRASLSDARREYFDSYQAWHKTNEFGESPFLRARMTTRRFEAPERLVPPVHPPRVTLSLASIPSRVSMLERVVERLLPQVDQLNVYLNNYAEVPSFLNRRRVSVVTSQEHGDIRDNGKFFFLDSCRDGIYFSADDDIDYPGDYVARLQAKLDAYQRAVVVGVHGTVFLQPFERFFRDRRLTHFRDLCRHDRRVHLLGTGTTAFYRDVLAIELADFASAGMADIWLARAAKKQNVPMVVIARPGGWLVPLTAELGDDLWTEYADRDHEQTKRIRESGPWDSPHWPGQVTEHMPRSPVVRRGWRMMPSSTSKE